MTDYAQLASQKFQEHFPKFGTARKLCTYKVMDESTYDTTLGEAVEAVNSTEQVYIIFDEFVFTLNQSTEFQNDDVPILAIDKIALFPVLDLTIVPKIGDQIVDPNGAIWTVMGVSSDPFSVAYTLHIRPIQA